MSKKFQHPVIQTNIKVRQPIGRQDSMQTVIRTSRKLDSFLNEAAQYFEAYSNIQVCNKKPIAVDVLFKAYPMIPRSCRSNVAG
jgi:hypothetical protein